MSLFSHPKFYAVYTKPDADLGKHAPVLVKEGFNIFAFLFGAFWSLYHRLWLVSFMVLLFNGVLIYAGREQWLTEPSLAAIQMGFQMLMGLQGNDWREAKLRKKGYMLADVALAESTLRAEQRYLERAITAQ